MVYFITHYYCSAYHPCTVTFIIMQINCAVSHNLTSDTVLTTIKYIIIIIMPRIKVNLFSGHFLVFCFHLTLTAPNDDRWPNIYLAELSHIITWLYDWWVVQRSYCPMYRQGSVFMTLSTENHAILETDRDFTFPYNRTNQSGWETAPTGLR